MSLHKPNFKKTKLTCFFTYLAMSSAFSLPPLLFLTFREMYHVSYTLLGTLVLVNFCTQLLIDLVFTFFTKYFNIKKTVVLMPLLTAFGLIVYAVIPTLFPDCAYLGLVIGTVIFSVAAGLCEVLMSPIVAALPSDNPTRDMSTLHSLYAYGVLGVILISSVFLKIFGTHNWMYLTLLWAVPPVISCILFCLSPIPDINLTENTESEKPKMMNAGLLLLAACIFLGSASENTMTNWISSFMESALHIPKAAGDILGMAAFAVLLGLGRSLFAKYGKNIYRVLLLGMCGAVVCYITAGASSHPLLSMAACILTGFCTSMLWPGTLILMDEKMPNPGVAAYALMAAGGDFGGSIAPQLLGAVADKVSQSPAAAQLGAVLALSPDQIGMKAGMLTAALFPILGIIVLLYIKKYFTKRDV